MFSSNTSQQSEGYQIQRSLRFNSADSAYLNRTPASAGNRRTFTWSGWIKLSATGIQRVLSASSGSADDFLAFASDTLRFQITDSGGTPVGNLITTQVFRDYSSWYHIVVAVDTTQATASNRLKMYVNGVQVTDFSTATYPAQNTDTLALNTAVTHYLSSVGGTNRYLNGYMTEVNFIDGQALTPSSFGQTNANTGVWEPKPYAGTYGTNGFYLNFSDNSNTTATTLGKDYSGNGNNWTPNNFSVSAGAGNDSLVDVPTPWGTDTGVGGSVRGNYCTWNPLKKGTSATTSNGNLDVSFGGSDTECLATIGMSSGKWYWEITPTAGSVMVVGIATDATNLNTYPPADGASWTYYQSGLKYPGASSYGASFTANDVIGVAFDADAGSITFYKNGVSQGVAFTGLTSGPYFPLVANANCAYTANFGQRPFAYTAPSGFKALCTQNLPTPTIGATAATQAGKYFNAVTYTAPVNIGTLTVTGVGFQPDFTWWKTRSAGDSNYLMNVLSGSNQYLFSNSTNAEATFSGIWTPTSDGFTASALSYSSNQSYVAWNWKANGAGVTNTAGSITSTVSANTTSGFSVVTFTSPASGAFTVGHGLGVAPAFVITKARNISNNWNSYHRSLGATQSINLNTTDAAVTVANWNNTSPTSTVFSFGSAFAGSYPIVMYCFAEVPGFSKFGSYTGNGSADGPFVYCGFRPAYVLIKSSNLTWNWFVFDEARSTYNAANSVLLPNSTSSEITGSNYVIDMLSNGFKIRTTDAQFNGSSSDTYIFAAFAEAPQKFALAR